MLVVKILLASELMREFLNDCSRRDSVVEYVGCRTKDFKLIPRLCNNEQGENLQRFYFGKAITTY